MNGDELNVIKGYLDDLKDNFNEHKLDISKKVGEVQSDVRAMRVELTETVKKVDEQKKVLYGNPETMGKDGLIQQFSWLKTTFGIYVILIASALSYALKFLVDQVVHLFNGKA